MTTPGRPPITHETRVFLYALAGGAPALALALVLLARSPAGGRVFWTVAVLLVLCWLGFALAARGRVVRPLQTLSNMLAALREGDYSIRARGSDARSALGLAFPTHTVAPKHDAALAEILHGAARGLSQRVGCPVYPFGGGTRERGPERARPAAPDARTAPARRRTA